MVNHATRNDLFCTSFLEMNALAKSISDQEVVEIRLLIVGGFTQHQILKEKRLKDIYLDAVSIILIFTGPIIMIDGLFYYYNDHVLRDEEMERYGGRVFKTSTFLNHLH